MATRKSLGAGILDNMKDEYFTQDLSGDNKFADSSVVIDEDKLRENLFEWVRYSQKYKPGNLMYYPENGLRPLEEKGEFTDEDVLKIVEYLMLLK